MYIFLHLSSRRCPPTSLQARRAYGHGHYYEAEGLTNRARGTAIYSIAIGIGLGIGMGVLLGVGRHYRWYS